MFTQDKIPKSPGRLEILRRFENDPSLFHARISIERHLPESPRIAHLRSKRKGECEDAGIGCAALHKLCSLGDVFPENQSWRDLVVNAESFQRRHRCATIRSVFWIGHRDLPNRWL